MAEPAAPTLEQEPTVPQQKPSEKPEDKNAVATSEEVEVAEQNGGSERDNDEKPKTWGLVEVQGGKKIGGEGGEASPSSSSSSAAAAAASNIGGVIVRSGTFKEESNLLSELRPFEKKALMELRSLLEDAILQDALFKQEADQDNNINTVLDAPPQKENSSFLTEKRINAKTSQGGKTEKHEYSLEGKEKKSSLQTEGKQEEEKPNNGTEEGKEIVPKNQTIEEEEEEENSTRKQGGLREEEEEDQTPEREGKGKEIAKEEIITVVEERRAVVVVVTEADKEISLWGVSLVPSKGDKCTDVVLLKFLRARELRVSEAFQMLRNTLRWRKRLKNDSILEEDFGADLNAAAYMSGLDREGHPVCYNVYGVFGNDEIYDRTFGTEERHEKFLRWRSQLMEKGIQKLDFDPAGVSSFIQINDLKNTPGPVRKELRRATQEAVELLQDNYPELVARNIFINVPFWYYAFNALLSPFLTQRTKSKFVFARPARVAETLLKYIAAEEIPVHYGGFKRDRDSEFSIDHQVMEFPVKAGSTGTIEILAPEVGTTLVWDLSVLGWEVNYREEFVPDDEGSYTLIVQKGRKIGWQEGSIRNSFTNREPGKVLLIVENNGSFKKKRVLYRYIKTNKNRSSPSNSVPFASS